MKIKLLHAVLHDGNRVEAGQIGDIDPAIAESLIASGAAVEVEEILDLPPAPLAQRPLEDLVFAKPMPAQLAPEDTQPEAAPAPAEPEAKPVEPEAKPTKAAKAEGK